MKSLASEWKQFQTRYQSKFPAEQLHIKIQVLISDAEIFMYLIQCHDKVQLLTDADVWNLPFKSIFPLKYIHLSWKYIWSNDLGHLSH